MLGESFSHETGKGGGGGWPVCYKRGVSVMNSENGSVLLPGACVADKKDEFVTTAKSAQNMQVFPVLRIIGACRTNSGYVAHFLTPTQ